MTGVIQRRIHSSGTEDPDFAASHQLITEVTEELASDTIVPNLLELSGKGTVTQELCIVSDVSTHKQHEDFKSSLGGSSERAKKE